MPRNNDPRVIFRKAYKERQACPLQLPGNPYKLEDAREHLDAMLDTGRAALKFERFPVNGGAQVSLGGCLAFERRRWTRHLLGKSLPYELGYNAVPGLEMMAQPALLARFTDMLVDEILPAVTSGLTLPEGEPMMVCLVDVLERSLVLIEETLAACEVDHA
mgnify:CR=1 FL=1